MGKNQDPGSGINIPDPQPVLLMFIPDPIFFHPVSQFCHPGSRILDPGLASKNLSILIQKIGFKLWEI
jgi:hypothetical protein